VRAETLTEVQKMSEEKYYLIGPWKMRKKQLSDVHLDEEHLIVRAEELPEPMGLSKPKPMRRLGRLLVSKKPRLLREGPDGIFIYKLENLPTHFEAQDHDTRPDRKERRTLRSIAQLLRIDSEFLGEVSIRGKRVPVEGFTKVQTVLNLDSWQEIGYGLLTLEPHSVRALTDIFATMVQPPRNTPERLHKSLEGLDSATVLKVAKILKGAQSLSEEGDITKVLWPEDLKSELKRLDSKSYTERIDASSKLVDHYLTIQEIIEPPKEGMVDRLIKSLRDPEPRVRANTAMVLGTLHSRKAIQLLGDLAMKDPDDIAREYSCFALGMILDWRVLNPLIAALDDEKPNVRGTAAMRLGMFAEEASFDEQIPKIEGALIRRRNIEEDDNLKAEYTKILKKIIRTK
jgi:hypothetical protein